MEASEVIELFGRLTMHQQAALMRLMSRNLMVELDSESAMGYDLDYNVEGAMIVARPAEPEPLGEWSYPAEVASSSHSKLSVFL